jgi:biopolymer transport protein ExbD
MNRPKIHRTTIALDMTAMCDVAFLLLTFFILTAQLKPNELDKIELPTSIETNACKGLQQGDKTLTITVNKDGKAVLDFNKNIDKSLIINSIERTKHIPFSPSEKLRFTRLSMFDTPITNLKTVLSHPNNLKTKGLNYTENNNELFDWIFSARMAEPNLRVAIKGDSRVDYSSISQIISTLQSQNVNVFKLITEYEKPII